MSTGLVTYSDAPDAMAFARSPFIALAVTVMIGRSVNSGRRLIAAIVA